ncbi:MAG: competence/damage-inducible protein A [Saprospiraceae bacterium]|nr:competence/damage-inducible protein A [Saprospiraceae bacterium]
MKVHIVTVGDEILIGQIVDTNSAWMAQQLNAIGAKVTGITTVEDTSESITAGLHDALKGVDAVLMTGGLGPTKDDITKKTIADFFGVDMYFDESSYNRLQRLFEKFGITPNESHRNQCFMPTNANLLTNKMGTAPGMWFNHEDKVIVSMPGVPYEMKYLMEYEVLPKLKAKFPMMPIQHRTIMTVGAGESMIAERIAEVEEGLPEHIKLAFLPNLGQVRLRLTGRGTDEATLGRELDHWVKEIEALIPELIYGYNEYKLQAAVGELLKERGLTLSTAESCTGGYLAHLITSISGSSAYFNGSVVAYANEVKTNQLSVSPQTLEDHGAVSEQTVQEMVKGLLNLLGTDIGVAISGIAGPTGGTPDKPVGTIWLAVGNQENIHTKKLQLTKDREKNIQYTAVVGLNMIRRFVIKSYQAAESI